MVKATELEVVVDAITSPVATTNGHFCRTCHSSWNCPPTTREVKEGITDGRLYCCDRRVVVSLNGETFPRLVDVARENKSLCGPRGRYWTPIKEMLDPVYIKKSPPVQLSTETIRSDRRGRERGPLKVNGVASSSGSKLSQEARHKTETRTTVRQPYKVG